MPTNQQTISIHFCVSRSIFCFVIQYSVRSCESLHLCGLFCIFAVTNLLTCSKIYIYLQNTYDVLPAVWLCLVYFSPPSSQSSLSFCAFSVVFLFSTDFYKGMSFFSPSLSPFRLSLSFPLLQLFPTETNPHLLFSNSWKT